MGSVIDIGTRAQLSDQAEPNIAYKMEGLHPVT
jgi:hypothetical protein